MLYRCCRWKQIRIFWHNHLVNALRKVKASSTGIPLPRLVADRAAQRIMPDHSDTKAAVDDYTSTWPEADQQV